MTCLETAGEGGPYGMALLAAYMHTKEPGQTLEDYLHTRVFAGISGTTLAPDPADAAGFDRYIKRYHALLEVERPGGGNAQGGICVKQYQFWFIVGSQFLYGPEVLETVAQRAAEMAQTLSKVLPYPLVYKITAKTNEEIASVVREANYDETCAGIIAWCHTFSPSKMWINGLRALQKPYCHLATQYHRAPFPTRPSIWIS